MSSSNPDQEAQHTFQQRKFDFEHFQGEMEAALSTALYSRAEYTALLEGRAMRLRPGIPGINRPLPRLELTKRTCRLLQRSVAPCLELHQRRSP